MMKKGKSSSKKMSGMSSRSKMAAPKKKTAATKKSSTPMMKKGGKLPKKYQDGTVAPLPPRTPGVSGIDFREEAMYPILPLDAANRIYDRAYEQGDRSKSERLANNNIRYEQGIRGSTGNSPSTKKKGGKAKSKKAAPKRMAKGGKMKGC